jgi:pantoate--beta-alanine ligase
MREWTRAERKRGRAVGFVPTMGALHAGHAALIRASRKRCDRTVVSLFVNPTQFGPTEDLASYPRPFAADRALCEKEGVDALFVPSLPVMYPAPAQAAVSVPPLQRSLCALGRPGHFDGVCLVVTKLLHIVEPDVVFFGQKDAQQVAVLTRLITDLDFATRVVSVPTVREPDGLALSSRNRYLDPEERAYAPRLYESLRRGAERVVAGERRSSVIVDGIRASLLAPPVPSDRVSVEYVELVDARTLQPSEEVPQTECLLALAVRVGRARLIDNVRIRPNRAAESKSKRRAGE